MLLFAGALFNGCQKSEFFDSETTGTGILKSASTFELPLYMDQTTPVGYAEITHDPATNLITVQADFDLPEGWEVVCASLYAGEEAPESASPGLFPNKDCEMPISFEIEGPEWECPGFTWNYALHIELRMQTGTDELTGEPIYEYETAWLLPEEGGMTWKNKGKVAKDTGWGQYFPWTFDYTPEITDISLVSDPGMLVDQDWLPSGVWTGVPEYPAFEMCLMANNPFYFFDVEAMDVSVPLKEDVMNEFFLTGGADEAFLNAWASKGVDASAVEGTWQYIMYQIITGDKPMFYLLWDGDQYDLIDGLQYLDGVGVKPLRINGSYPAGTYTFTGDVAGEYCTLEDFTISLTVAPCPAP